MDSRGSEKLIEQMFDDPAMFTQRDLKAVVDLSRQERTARLLKILIRGTPRPDWFEVHMEAKPGQVGSLVDSLVGLEGSRLQFDVFPYGIVNPDMVHVVARTSHQAR